MNPSDILQVAGGVAILAVPVLGAIWLIVHSIRKRGKIAAAYQTFAQHRGLAFLSPMPFPQLHGQVDGREFVIGNFPHARNPQAFEFRMALGLRGFDADTIICKGGLLDSTDVKTGDAWFDKKVVVKTAHHEAVRAYLTPDRIAALREIIGMGVGSGIFGGKIVLQGQKDFKANAQWFEVNLARLSTWAPRLDAA